MAGRGTLVVPRRSAQGSRTRADALCGLVSRLMFAQAGASAAVSLSYGRRHLPSLLLAAGVAVALFGLAGLLRSGSHAWWLAAVSIEAGFVAVGLFRFGYARYLGGTLLAIIALGTLVHPAVARAYAARHDWSNAADHPSMASALIGESSS
jgi:hypothetical protein